MITADYLRTESARINRLCAGHYDIRKFEKVVAEEYAGSRAVEKKYRKRFPITLNPHMACRVVGRITDTLKVRRVRKLVLDSDLAASCGAVYNTRGKEIHFPFDSVYTMSLLHEVTHHVCIEERYGGGHGDRFCEMFELVCEAALEVMA